MQISSAPEPHASAAVRASYAVNAFGTGHVLNDEERYVSRSLGVDHDRPLLHFLITFIADDEPATFGLRSPPARQKPSQDMEAKPVCAVCDGT